MVKAVTPIPFVKARFFDRCGKPLAGGKVHTYEANTTTPKVTYKDPYGLTPNTNPIVLDAAGEADIYLDGTYRIRITDRNDVLVNDVAKIGSWFSDNLQDSLNDVSSAMGEALKPTLQNLNDTVDAAAIQVNQKLTSLDDAINTAAAAAAGANGWTDLLISTSSEITQRQVNDGLESIADLLSIKKPRDKQRNYVKSYHANLKKGGGWFYFDSASTLAVNGGTVLAANDGTAGRWLRQLDDIAYVTPEMFGAKSDGVTDDYNAIVSAINSFTKGTLWDGTAGQTVKFGKFDYYLSDTLNLKTAVNLIGEQSSESQPKTVLYFPVNKDGIIVNRRNTNGATGTVAAGSGADGAMIQGIAVRQKNFTHQYARVLDYNPSTLKIIAMTSASKFAVGDNITEYWGFQTGFSATVAALDTATRNLGILNSSNAFMIGETITGGTSGATGVVVYKSDNIRALSLKSVTGTFQANETITGGTSGIVSKITSVNSTTLTVYDIISPTGSFSNAPHKGDSVLIKTSTYGTGILLRARAHIKDVLVNSWGRNGIAANTVESGNANNFTVDNVVITSCNLDALFTIGGDCNAGKITALDVRGNGGYGVRDHSFLGNHYFSCHVAANAAGAYWSAYQNNYSVFAGCYSEGDVQVQPYYVSTSKFGKDTTVIGGDHGAGMAQDYSLGGFSYLGSREFQVGNKAIATKGDSSGRADAVEMNFEGSAPTLDLIVHGGSFGYGAFIQHFVSSSKNYTPIDSRQESVKVGKYGIFGDSYNSGTYQLYLAPLQAGSAGISVTGGGATTNASLVPIISGGVVTGFTILHAGVGYTSPPTITGTGIWAGLTAKADIANGQVVNVTVTNSPTGLTSLDPVLTLSIRSDKLTPNLDNTMSLGLTATRFKQGFINDLRLKPSASVTPSVNGELAFELTNDTTLKLKVKGSDGVVRSATLTLV